MKSPRLKQSRLRGLLLGGFVLLFAATAAAVGTRRLTLDKEADFKGGDLKGVAIDSVGHVRAGFSLGTLPVTQAPSVWSALPQKDGSLLLGTANEGKLLKLAGGAVSVLAETKAIAVTSLAEAWGGTVVLGTLPDGKVMKYERGKLSDLATLKGAQHVWHVAFDAKSNSLYAATGPEGKLFRIGAGGEAQVLFDAEEQHLMSVAVAPDGTVYAGASDKAKLYKITGPGRATVLYDFARTEVRSIAIGPKGEIYAIANELKGVQIPTRQPRGSETSPAGPVGSPGKNKGKGTLFRFTPDGKPDRLLDNEEEHFTSLTLGDDGQPYVGTGVEGRVYTVDAAHHSALVADVDERQIGALVLKGAQKYVIGSDPIVVHAVRGVGGPDAIWTSKVFDAGLRARFGLIDWESTGAIEVSTRTGNTKEPDETWSPWSKDLAAPANVDSPAARFIQIRARFAKDKNAELSELNVSFLTDNLRATIDNIEVKGRSTSNDDAIKSSGGPVSKKGDSKVSLGWKVDNPDKDDLRYRLKYRLVGTNTWFDLTERDEKLTKESYDWETGTLPEGRYRVHLSATDELANPPDRVTRDEMESGVVLVDNTPPRVERLRAAGRKVQATVVDGVGPIQRVEVSLGGKDDWVPFFPVDGIFDEAQEDMDIDVSSISPAGPALLAVRAFDEAGNAVVVNVMLK
jgi:hypothetical protein